MDVRSQVPVQTALALTVLLAWPGLAQAAPGPLHAGPLLSDAPVQAPTPPPRRPISLDEAVALALEQNLEIRVERLNP